MATAYSFLKDDLALLEIRKHQWIESEKKNEPIGFATAAVDWVKKHGSGWKKYRLKAAPDQVVFSEKRLHRRFSVQFPVQVACEKNLFKSQTQDVSIVGLSCTLPEPLAPDTQANVTLLVKDKGKAKSQFQFKAKVTRISQFKGKNGYHVFLPFNEEVRDYLRTNVQILNN